MITTEQLKQLVRLRVEENYSISQLEQATGIDGSTISWELKQFGKAHKTDLNSPRLPKVRKTSLNLAKAQSMQANGASLHVIASKMGVSFTTIQKWLKNPSSNIVNDLADNIAKAEDERILAILDSLD